MRTLFTIAALTAALAPSAGAQTTGISPTTAGSIEAFVKNCHGIDPQLDALHALMMASGYYDNYTEEQGLEHMDAFAAIQGLIRATDCQTFYVVVIQEGF